MLILASLANGVKHGYAMMQDIESFSSNKLGPGNTAISLLVEQALIEPEAVEYRQRPYRMTALGVAASGGSTRGDACARDPRIEEATLRMKRSVVQVLLGLYP